MKNQYKQIQNRFSAWLDGCPPELLDNEGLRAEIMEAMHVLTKEGGKLRAKIEKKLSVENPQKPA